MEVMSQNAAIQRVVERTIKGAVVGGLQRAAATPSSPSSGVIPNGIASWSRWLGSTNRPFSSLARRGFGLRLSKGSARKHR